MTDVFISYARATAVQARAAAEALRARGYAVWLDQELPAHGSFAEAIEQRIGEAKAVLVIWSDQARQSDWVRSEANRAREQHKLVQISMDATPPPMPFEQLQCIPLVGWLGDLDENGWTKVTQSIAKLVGRPSVDLAEAGHPQSAPDAAAPAPQSPLLAVMAFDNLSADSEMNFFSDGVAEEIQQTLSRSPGLRVIARSSAFQFRGAGKAVRNVATQLKVTHLLDGSVRRSGNRVRITAQLVDCANEVSLWSDRFDRQLDDIFALQDDIAAAVAQALQVVFSPAPPTPELALSTYELFLRAQSIITEGGREFDGSGAEAAPLLEQVVREAPGHARAWELLANASAWTLRFGERAVSYEEGRARVVEAAETALRLDRTRAGAYEALAMLEPWGCYKRREILLEQALRLAPNDPGVLTSMSNFYWSVGRIRDSLNFAERASALNPLFPAARLAVAQMYTYLGDYEVSLRMMDEIHRRWPLNVNILNSLIGFSASLRLWTYYDAAVPDIARFEGTEFKLLERGVAYARILRDSDPAPRLGELERLRSRLASGKVIALNQIVAMEFIGFPSEGLEIALQAPFDHMFDPDGPLPGFVYPGILFGPWNSMNRDPKFVALCDKLGLCDYWIETGRWPDCAATAPYDFKAAANRMARAVPA